MSKFQQPDTEAICLFGELIGSYLVEEPVSVNAYEEYQQMQINRDVLYKHVAQAASASISKSDLSRQQVADAVSELMEGPLSGHMLNNHLSKPTESRLPIWVLAGIILVLGDPAPLRELAHICDCEVITRHDLKLLEIGRLTVAGSALNERCGALVREERTRLSQRSTDSIE